VNANPKCWSKPERIAVGEKPQLLRRLTRSLGYDGVRSDLSWEGSRKSVCKPLGTKVFRVAL
jgi:hypothetical protein